MISLQSFNILSKPQFSLVYVNIAYIFIEHKGDGGDGGWESNGGMTASKRMS